MHDVLLVQVAYSLQDLLYCPPDLVGFELSLLFSVLDLFVKSYSLEKL